MLKNILKLISRDRYISRSRLAKELGVDEGLVDDGIAHLLKMGYLLAEDKGGSGAVSCVNCPFARNCSQEAVKCYKIADKIGRASCRERV